jgi:hypothetical protein
MIGLAQLVSPALNTLQVYLQLGPLHAHAEQLRVSSTSR